MEAKLNFGYGLHKIIKYVPFFQVFVANWNAIGFHRFSPWYKRINQFVSRMIESGLFTFWEMR